MLSVSLFYFPIPHSQTNMQMDKTLQVQLQIRQNAEEISSALKDIGSWEKRMREKDRTLQKKGKKAEDKKTCSSIDDERIVTKPRSGGGTVPLRSNVANSHASKCWVSIQNP